MRIYVDHESDFVSVAEEHFARVCVGEATQAASTRRLRRSSHRHLNAMLIIERSKKSRKAQGIPDFQAPPPIPKFIDTAHAIDELPSYDSFEPSPDDLHWYRATLDRLSFLCGFRLLGG